MIQFLPFMGGFSSNFAPMIGAFFAIRHGGWSVAGRTSVAISRASTSPRPGLGLSKNQVDRTIKKDTRDGDEMCLSLVGESEY